MADLSSPTALRFPAPARFQATSVKTGSAFEVGAPRHDIGKGIALAAVAALIFAVLYCIISGAREDIYAATHPAVVVTR